ncbi:MAG TPA: hypothetical protein VH601_20440 [Bryobacteraceae bacterium]|jgi:hypothetical protein
MAKKNNMAGVLSGLSGSKSGTGLSGGSTTVTNLVVPLADRSLSSTSTLTRLTDMKTSDISGTPLPKSIQFGTPSSTKTTTSSSNGNSWSKLLTQTASGGLASALGNGFGSIGGLGSVVSGLVHLFGGGSKPETSPLARFQLPNSKTQTVYIGSQRTSVLQGAAFEQSIKTDSQPIYSSTGAHMSAPPSQHVDAATIVQTVKQALLSSCSLNDVISEI